MTASNPPPPPPSPLPRRAEFPWYLGSSSMWLAAMTLQGFLIQWLLVFHLQVEAMEFGISRALMEAPPLVMLLIGGIFADRVDGRRLLLVLSVCACLPPLVMAAVVGQLSYWTIVAFGIVMALLQSASDPARAAMLNRVTRIDIQRTVTITTIVTSGVAIVAFGVGGRVEFLGLVVVFIIQAGLFAGTTSVAMLAPQPPVAQAPDLAGGLRALWRAPLVRNVIGLNFASSLFNAGAYLVVMPLVVREAYAGGSEFLSNMNIAFTIGSTGSNIVLLAFMPLLRPGRLFLLMQLTRAAILVGLWWEPPAWLFFTLVVCWGANMGVTSTLARTTVQELAPAAHRAKILAVLLASFMVASPASALILGFVVAHSDAPSGLLPGVMISLAIFAAGALVSGLWKFESPSYQATVPRR